MPLKHWLSLLLCPILSVLGMSDTSWAYLEFPSTPIGVENWERQLVDKYSTLDDAYNHMNDICVLNMRITSQLYDLNTKISWQQSKKSKANAKVSSWNALFHHNKNLTALTSRVWTVGKQHLQEDKSRVKVLVDLHRT